ncbi:hypothetical protein AB0C81_18595 [Streptomyces roseoverticillatus]|uniref:RNA polymerase sigma factor n=1 Tax=Streptomyces roseoverticillatus TaxID=66429 RepID=UPI0033FF9B1F
MEPLPRLQRARRPPSDRALLRAVGDGRLDQFRHLYHRHYRAAYAYAVSCMPAPLDAHGLVRQAFKEVADKALSQQALSTPYYGCLRQNLIDCIRRRAVAQFPKAANSLSPAFRDWVARGCLWPLAEDGQLALAFSQLSPLSRCLVWHSLVENDTLAVISTITGVEAGSLAQAQLHARQSLHRARANLYLLRSERPVCQHENILPVPRSEALAADWTAVAPRTFLCPECPVPPGLVDLDLHLEAQLPPALLGWWPGHAYLRAKESLPPQAVAPPLRTTPARHRRSRPITASLGPAVAPSRGHSPLTGRRRDAVMAAIPMLVVLLLIGVTTSVLVLSGSVQS